MSMFKQTFFTLNHLYKQTKEDEPEFVDDYEKPKLEKYEKITPTPLEKKTVDKDKKDTPKTKKVPHTSLLCYLCFITKT